MGNHIVSFSLNSVELEIARPFFLSNKNPVSYMSGITGGREWGERGNREGKA